MPVVIVDNLNQLFDNYYAFRKSKIALSGLEICGSIMEVMVMGKSSSLNDECSSMPCLTAGWTLLLLVRIGSQKIVESQVIA